MTTSPAGIALIKRFEGCILHAYQDQRGIWTIGYGHTGRDVHAGMICTQAQADAWLREDLASAEATICRLVRRRLAQCQFDALVSLVYNIGSGNFTHSTILKLLNSGEDPHASLEFVKWDEERGKPDGGLLHRRIAETVLFNGGVPATV